MTYQRRGRKVAHKNKEGRGVLGMRLKEERLRRQWHVEDFAAECGIHTASITAFENRGVIPKLHNLMKIAFVLECSIDWLVGMDEYEIRRLAERTEADEGATGKDD